MNTEIILVELKNGIFLVKMLNMFLFLFVIGSEDTKLDEVTMLLAIAVFVLHAPPDVVSAPNLQYPCINQFRQCLQSNNVAVSLIAVFRLY